MSLELVAAICICYVPPRYVFGGSLITFGICSALLAPGKSYAGAIILRLMIGVAEAFGQIAYLYVTLWYKPNERASRTGKFTSNRLICG
jgi:MFS family permease